MNDDSIKPGDCDSPIPLPLVGKRALVGSLMTRLEINQDRSGSIVGSVWGMEPATWSASGSRLAVAVERGVGSADYAAGDNGELVLSNAHGVLVGGTYVPVDEQAESRETIVW